MSNHKSNISRNQPKQNSRQNTLSDMNYEVGGIFFHLSPYIPSDQCSCQV